MSTYREVDTYMKQAIIVSAERLIVKLRRDGRNVYSAEGKRALVEACLRPGASISGVALAHGVNANLLGKWINQYRATRQSSAVSPVLLPVALQGEIPTAVGTRFAIPEAARQRPASPPPSLIVMALDGARIELTGQVDREALAAVLDCLKQSRAAQ